MDTLLESYSTAALRTVYQSDHFRYFTATAATWVHLMWYRKVIAMKAGQAGKAVITDNVVLLLSVSQVWPTLLYGV